MNVNQLLDDLMARYAGLRAVFREEEQCLEIGTQFIVSVRPFEPISVCVQPSSALSTELFTVGPDDGEDLSVTFTDPTTGTVFYGQIFSELEDEQVTIMSNHSYFEFDGSQIDLARMLVDALLADLCRERG